MKKQTKIHIPSPNDESDEEFEREWKQALTPEQFKEEMRRRINNWKKPKKTK